MVAARDPTLAARYAALHRRTVEGIVATLEAAFAALGRRPALPLPALAVAELALDAGGFLEDLADPGSVPDDQLADLPRLPVMTKSAMMAHFEEVVTTASVTRAGAEAAIAATTTLPLPIDGQYLVLASGGSSGERGLFVFDPDAFAEFGALADAGVVDGEITMEIVDDFDRHPDTGKVITRQAGDGTR